MAAVPVTSRNCLHLVAGPGSEALERSLAHFRPGDTLLFLDAAVTGLLRPEELPEKLPREAVLYASADLAARGLLGLAQSRGLRLLDDPDFPGLLAGHELCLTWK